MARIGGNLEDMRSLQSTFTSEAGTVESLMSNLGNKVNSVDWEGGAASRFREAWASDFRPALQRLQAALNEASGEVSSRVQALEQAGG